MLEELKKDLEDLQDEERAKILQRFFKTGKGQYGEGDVFLGIMAPEMRRLAKRYEELHLIKIQELLSSKYNEARWIALVILVNRFKKLDELEKEDKKNIVDFYLKNTKNVNNWNLVDISAPHILGNFLFDRDKKILHELAESENLWERRIAIVSTWTLIRRNHFETTLEIAKKLLRDEHDLIHKAVGWMLREVGKKKVELLENFLKENYDKIPRTALRYAIERFEEEKRKKWLRREIE